MYMYEYEDDSVHFTFTPKQERDAGRRTLRIRAVQDTATALTPSHPRGIVTFYNPLSTPLDLVACQVKVSISHLF
jgi:hypothetical protein